MYSTVCTVCAVCTACTMYIMYSMYRSYGMYNMYVMYKMNVCMYVRKCLIQNISKCTQHVDKYWTRFWSPTGLDESSGQNSAAITTCTWWLPEINRNTWNLPIWQFLGKTVTWKRDFVLHSLNSVSPRLGDLIWLQECCWQWFEYQYECWYQYEYRYHPTPSHAGATADGAGGAP